MRQLRPNAAVIARLMYLSVAECALRVAAVFLSPIFGFAQDKGSFVATIVPVVINMKNGQTGTREGAFMVVFASVSLGPFDWELV